MTVIVDGTAGISTPNVSSSNGMTITGTLSVSNTVTFADSTAFNTAYSLGMRNRIINGGFDVWQKGTSFTGPSSATTYLADRWVVSNSITTAGATFAQSTDVPPGSGFNYSMLQTVTATQSTVNTGNFYGFWQGIEGYNTAHLAYGTSAAKTVTLSFWVKSSVTGTYVANIYQLGTNPRVFPYTYTISSANTWTFISVVIPGDTVANAMSTTNNGSIYMYFYTMLSASSFSNGTLNVWNTNSGSNQYGGSSGGVNLFATSGATWQITGVQLEIGSVATPFEKRLFGNELALCQRYFCKSYNSEVAPGAATTVGATAFYSPTSQGNRPIIQTYFPVTMRATPTVTAYSPNNGATGNFYNADQTTNVTVSSINLGASGATWYVNSAMTVGVYGIGHWTASAEF